MRSDEAEVRVALVLYVLDGSAACERAFIESIHAVSAFPRGQVSLDIRNLSRGERTAEDREILVVPTLVMTRPARAYLVRRLSRDDIVAFVEGAGGIRAGSR